MFHLWPQGRIVRICVMILAALICVDLAYNGAWAAIGTILADPRAAGIRAQYVLAALYGLLALAALVTGMVCAGPHRRAVQFLIEVQDEMRRVTWPKLSELWRSTFVVALAIVVLAGIVLLTNFALLRGLDIIQKR